MQDDKPLVIVVGGFLGAGKTTLIHCAAAMLARQGARVAVIVNDQGDHLVDTGRLRAAGLDAAEVGGGCFCCRFSAFLDAAGQLLQFRPEYIFAEPVGSCMDLVATVMRPLSEACGDRFRLAPFTVLVDPEIRRRALTSNGSSHLRFLFQHQVSEADVLCYTKADQYRDAAEFPAGDALHISARTGEGVKEWLALVSGWRRPVGEHPLTVDYDAYAAAERSLGWLNARARIALHVPSSPARLLGPIVDAVDCGLAEAHASILHLKVFDQTASSYMKAAIIRNGAEPAVEGDLLAPAERTHELLLNLRAVAPPELLRAVVERVLKSLAGEVTLELNAFAPAYPRPERRAMAAV
jgi:hypothetical protein